MAEKNLNDFSDDFSDEDKQEVAQLNFYNFEKDGKEIVGKFLKYVEFDGDFGIQTHAVIETAKGEVILPNHKALVNQMKNLNVVEGEKMKIVQGSKTKSKNKNSDGSFMYYFNYEIYLKR